MDGVGSEAVREDSWWRRWRGDVAGLVVLAVLAALYLSPALVDGGSFGTFDFVLPLTSLGRGLYPAVPHNAVNSDVISQMVAWQAYNWRAVHHLQFPLFNDQNLLGVPQFLNFESAPLSLPDLVAYLVPLRFAFLVTVYVKLLVAGTGSYVFCRTVRLGRTAAVLAGTTFMLSGAFANWLTWPLSDVIAWLGWLAALVVLAYRWQGRRRYVAALAVATAFCVYGGFPEANVFVIAGLAVLFGVCALATLARRRRLSAAGVGRVALGVFAGAALSAPLWFPGLQVIHLAHRETETGFPGDPARALALIVAPGFYGLPIKGSAWFLPKFNYYETVVYLGVIVLVLALAAVLRFWRHPMVLGLVAMVVVTLVVSYQTASFHVVQDFLNHHGLGTVEFLRMRSILGFPLGVLAALGLDGLVRSRGRRGTLVAYAVATAVVALFVAVLCYRAASEHLPASLEHLRDQSLVWPVGLVVACVVAGLLVAASGRLVRRPAARRLAVAGAAVLVFAEAAFLVFAGVGINSYSHRFYPETPAIARLRAIVGSGLIGLDTGNRNVQSFSGVGFFPNVNLGYDLALYAGHDPLLPQAYFTTWPGVAHGGKGGAGLFVPDIDDAELARTYGIDWILASPGISTAPAGTRYVATLAGERLYAVPGAARFTVAGGKVTAVEHPVASSWSFTESSPGATTLVLRVTSLPGWHATIDGRPLALTTSGGLLLTAEVPAGRHAIRLWYLPERLVVGTLAALLAALGLVAYLAGDPVRRRLRRRRSGTAEPPAEPVMDDLGLSFAAVLAGVDPPGPSGPAAAAPVTDDASGPAAPPPDGARPEPGAPVADQ